MLLLTKKYSFISFLGYGGLCSESDYPYADSTYVNGTAPNCSVSCAVVDDSAPSSYVYVENTTEAFESAVTQQPVSIAIHIDSNFKVSINCCIL